jgi:hypothetical protein
MIPVRVKEVERPPSAAKIAKNINFGVALGLTETAKQGQKAVIGALRGTFTLRGSWFNQSNKFGIKIKAAKREDLSAEVRTRADWLLPHETGKDKTGRGGRVAVPTDNVRRNKRQIITKAQRPTALRNKRTFVIKTKRGDVLYQRKYRGKRSFIVPLYGLERRVRIRKQSTFFEPIEKVVKRRINANIGAGLRRAFATMK